MSFFDPPLLPRSGATLTTSPSVSCALNIASHLAAPLDEAPLALAVISPNVAVTSLEQARLHMLQCLSAGQSSQGRRSGDSDGRSNAWKSAPAEEKRKRGSEAGSANCRGVERTSTRAAKSKLAAKRFRERQKEYFAGLEEVRRLRQENERLREIFRRYQNGEMQLDSNS